MKYLILADIHANIHALEKVIKTSRGDYDRIVVLGDIVGYGAYPNECVELLKKVAAKTDVCLKGNHDAAAVGELDFSNFQATAQEAIRWTQKNLKSENATFLKGLLDQARIGDVYYVHGTLTHPLTEYMIYDDVILANFNRLQDGEMIFCGHHHVAHVMQFLGGSDIAVELVTREKEYVLGREHRFIVKTFSVGFPRDGNPMAGWCFFDDEKRLIAFRRVKYNIHAAMRGIEKAGLPAKNAQRLKLGI